MSHPRLLSFVLWLFLCSPSVSQVQSSRGLDDDTESPRNSLVTRPNVLVMLADDAGWGDFSSSGNTQVSTPHIDSIAAHGIKFDRFFVCPVCSPTRAEFLTGRYHARCGVHGVSEGAERLNLDERTIAEAFQAAGYATGLFGKWHNGSQWPYHPRARGFDEFFGYTEGHWGEYFQPMLEDSQGEFQPTDGYIVDVCTDKAIAFLKRNKERPFFCFVPFTTPHSPWAVPQEDWQRFSNKDLKLRGQDPTREDLDQTRCVLAMMENQDRNAGRILETLRDLNQLENTIIVYFSDNGPQTVRWNGDMKGQKGSVDEGGIRSVCYIQWPNQIRPGRTYSSITGAVDLLPTLLGLASIPRVGNKHLDGIDLSGWLIHDQLPENANDRIIFSSWQNKVSLRTDRYRLDTNQQLFDMQKDPAQKRPIMGESEYATVHRELSAKLHEWRSIVDEANRNLPTRPFSVGYEEFPITQLPARDGVGRGGIKRSANAPNSSYFVNWSKLDDAIVWDIQVETAGTYEVRIEYTCPIADAGSTLELSFLDRRLESTVTEAWDPPLFENQDTIPRPKVESKMKQFRSWVMGVIDLPADRAELQLRATKIPGQSVMDLRRLTLKLVAPTKKKEIRTSSRFEARPWEVVSVGDGWSKWRGERGDAQVTGLPKTWSKPERLWRVPLDSNGVGGLAVSQDVVAVSGRDILDQADVFQFLDATTGVELSRLTYPSELELDYGNSPRATPVILEETILCLGAAGQLHAVNLETGEVIWKTHLVADLGGKMPDWGYATSPLVYNNEVFIQPGGLESAWVCLDLATGKLKWRSTGRKGAYGSPLLVRSGERLGWIGFDDKTIGAWEATKGDRLWELRPQYDRDFNVPSPLLFDNKLFLQSENNGARLYQFSPEKGEEFKIPVLLAESDELSHDSNSPIRVDRWIAGVHDGLIFLDPNDNLRLHTKLEDAAYNSYCSMIADGNRLLLTSAAGDAILVQVDESGAKELGRFQFEESQGDILAHAAFEKGVYFVRGPRWVDAYRWN